MKCLEDSAGYYWIDEDATSVQMYVVIPEILLKYIAEGVMPWHWRWKQIM